VRGEICLQRCAAWALWGLLALFGSSWPTFADDGKSLTGMLLVAGDDVEDSDFTDAVVLVLNNLGPAPAGVIINKPMQVGVSQLFPKLKRLENSHDKVYFGGPVEFGTVWFLFRASTQPEHAVRACDGVYLSADPELLLKLLNRAKPMDGLRIFVGHSGWAPGQLEEEIAHGDWALKRAEPNTIFNGNSEHPWPSPSQAPKSST